MPTSIKQVVNLYLKSRASAYGTKAEYNTTVRKWNQWSQAVTLEQLDRSVIRDFLKWVHDEAAENGGSNPGRTANKARAQLRAVVSWAWENDLIETPPRFPKALPQRDVAGRHYLTKAELNALYFATHQLRRPRGWNEELPVGKYWRAALVTFFNYGLDSGTVWGITSFHKPLLWKDVCWSREAPSRAIKQSSRWGWLSYRRIKTSKFFCRPMNRAVHAHLKSLVADGSKSDAPVFLGGGSRPNIRFRELCDLAGIATKTDIETGEPKAWVLKDLRKTCATYYDEHMPESSIEILGHSVGGVTYRHYAHRAPLAHKAIMTLPQPTAFSALARGFDQHCPCCRRAFAEAT